MKMPGLRLRLGYEFEYDCPLPVPMILLVSVHDSRAGDIEVPDSLNTEPAVPVSEYRDSFGNRCHRLIAPPGPLVLRADGVVRDSGLPDPFEPDAREHAVEELPYDTLVYLLGSRYCDTDLLSQTAWNLFGSTPPGWGRVQAICDYVHDLIAFDYQNARPTRTAADAFRERTGVCRDFAHLAIALCRCMNVPARYCTGYVSDVGTAPPWPPGDFAAWFEVYLSGRWHSFDPRNNQRRIGRVLMARGRDAADVAIVTSFGPNQLRSFRVWTEEEKT